MTTALLVVWLVVVAGSPGAVGAVDADLRSTAATAGPYTGVTATQRSASYGVDPASKTVDGRTSTMKVQGSRTSSAEAWSVLFTPSDGAPVVGVELTKASQPLGVGNTDAVARVWVNGDVCQMVTPGDAHVLEYVADPATGRPRVLAVDLSGGCRGTGGQQPYYVIDAKLRLRASTPYGGLDLPRSVINWGFVPPGEGTVPETVTARYVGAGSVTVARAAVEPIAPTQDGYPPDDYRLDEDTCTGAVLVDGSSCRISVSARRMANYYGFTGLLVLRSADGSPLARVGVGFYATRPDRTGSIIPQATRALDTRRPEGTGVAVPVPAHGIVAFSARGREASEQDVAQGTSLVNLIAVTPAGSGYLSALAPGALTSSTSSVNFSAGQTVSNLVMAPVDAKGMVHVLNVSDRPVHVVADLEGLLPAPGPCPVLSHECGGRLHPVPSSRILDTRTAAGGARPLAAGQTDLHVDLPSQLGGAYAVLATVTVVNPPASGWVRVGDTYDWAGSSVNFSPGRTTSNTVLARVLPEGLNPQREEIPVVVGGAPVHVVIDVTAVLDYGYYWGGEAVIPLATGPTRIADSRRGLGLTTLVGGRAGTLTVPSALRGPDTVGVVHNLTAIASHQTWLTAYPTGSARPPSSVLYVATPGVRAATTLTMTSAGGSLDIYSIAGPTDVVSDVAARVDLWPPTERLHGFPRLPTALPAVGLATRSR